MIVLHPTTCLLFLVVLLIPTSRSISSRSPAKLRPSIVGKRQPNPYHQSCSGVFTWDPKNPDGDAICIPVDGPRYACKANGCLFKGERLTQENFVFQDCYWDYPQEKGAHFHGDIHATEMYYMLWDPKVPNKWIAVTGTQSLDPKSPVVHASCFMAELNLYRPFCRYCVEAPVKAVQKGSASSTGR